MLLTSSNVVFCVTAPGTIERFYILPSPLLKTTSVSRQPFSSDRMGSHSAITSHGQCANSLPCNNNNRVPHVTEPPRPPPT